MKLLDTAKTVISSVSILLFITLMVSCAAEPYSLETWDYDDNLYLDEDEFYSGLDDLGYYDTWNYDGVDYLTEEEWNEGIDTYFDSYDGEDYGDFSEWDEDNDGVLSEEEFESSVFDTADLDDNDQIDDEEYNTWYDDDLE